MKKNKNTRIKASRQPAPAKSSVASKFGFKRPLSDTQRWVLGFLLLFVALYLLIATLSYYFTWHQDQAAMRDGFSWSLDDDASNSAGKVGAVTGASIVGKYFGLFGICIPIILIVLALRIMRIKPLFLNRSVRITFMVMILGSLSLGYLFGTRWGVFGTGLGGQSGIAVADWMRSMIGTAGLGLFLIVAWILLAVYINKSTVKVVNRIGSAVAKGTSDILGKSHTSEPDDEDEVRDERMEEYNETESDAGETVEHREYMQEQRQERERTEKLERSDWRREGVSYDNERGSVQTGDTFRTGEYSGERTSDHVRHESRREHTDELSVVTTAPHIGHPGKSPFIDDDDDFEIGGIDDERYEKHDLTVEEEVFKYDDNEDDDLVVVDRKGQHVRASELRTESVRPEATLGAGGVVISNGDDMEIIKTDYQDTEAEEEIDDFRDPTRTLPHYQKPSWLILKDHSKGITIPESEINENKRIIQAKLEDFGIRINDRIKATIGPTVTLYEIEPAQGVKVSRIRNLEEDIALALKLDSVRIMTLGHGRGTVGIEVPNSTRETVSMLSVIKSEKFQNCQYKLPMALGRTIYNEIYIGDLTKMPHLLVAGATGQGKSVGLNAIITSLLYKKHPAELKFVMIDPKQVELASYAKLANHFLAKMEGEEDPIITDTGKAVSTLNSLVMLMEERYTLLRRAGERNIADYNACIQSGKLKKRDGHAFMPYIVVVIDEFADLIMTAGREIETPITRLAQKSRAIGIHLIIATQRPDVKVITGLIKSNIPARIAFKVAQMVDSRTIIDQPGANNLIGQGDMLILLNGELTRIQCAFLDTPETDNITSFIAQQDGYDGPFELPYCEVKGSSSGSSGGSVTISDEGSDSDNMLIQVAHFIVQNQQGSTSAIQRNFRLGYNRAGRIMDKLEKMGIVGRQDGSKPREVIVTDSRKLEEIISFYDEDELNAI